MANVPFYFMLKFYSLNNQLGLIMVPTLFKPKINFKNFINDS
jgi:hypothetical protein